MTITSFIKTPVMTSTRPSYGFITTTTTAELRKYHDFVDKYKGLRQGDGMVEAQEQVNLFFESHSSTFPSIKDDYDKVYSVIAQAYMFSDHKNKYFEPQYEYLIRTHPTITDNLTKDILIEMIAIASNNAFYWFSD